MNSNTQQDYGEVKEYTPPTPKREPYATIKVRVPKSLKSDFEKVCGLFNVSSGKIVKHMLTTWIADRKEWMEQNGGNPPPTTP